MTTALLVWVRVLLVKMVKCHKLVFSMWATTLVFSGVLLVLALGQECQLQQEGVCVCGDPSVHSYCNSSTCAPDDFDSSCRTPSAVSGDNVVLFDSNDYKDILDAPNSVWIMGNTEAGTSQWHQQGESCQNHLLMCTFSAQTNYWIFSQYIKYPMGSLFLGNTDIFINISTMLLSGSVSIHVYETNNIVSVTERSNTSNYRPLVSSDSGQETIINASVSEITIRHTTSGKFGFYIGIKNNGIACGQITRILLYYTPCKEQQDGLVYYPELVRPPAGSPSNEAKACCAANSHPTTSLTFRAYSISDGRCERNVVCECEAGYKLGGTGMECEICPIGTFRSLAYHQDQCMDCPPNTVGDTEGASLCKCVAGYQRSKPESDCLPCPAGTYRSFSDPRCIPCPLNTAMDVSGTSVCECLEGYFRAKGETPSVPCAVPPGPVLNLQASNTRDTSVSVRWERPEVTGRDDFYYSVEYSDPDNTGSFIVSDSRYVNAASTVTYTVSGLQPNIPYTIRVTTHNGVSDQDPGNEALRIRYQFVKTNEGVPSVPQDVRAFPGIVVWRPPAEPNGVITGYEVRLVGSVSSQQFPKAPTRSYHIVRDINALGKNIQAQVRTMTSAGLGPYSDLVNDVTENTPVKLMLRGQAYTNNTFVRIIDIGEGDDALLCVTDRIDCCRNPQRGALYYPNGDEVMFSSTTPIWRDRTDSQVVRLNRRNNALSPLGRYRCAIPDSNGVNRSIYINVIHSASCPIPPTPSNGFVSVTGVVASYSCSPGYYLDGRVARSCQSNGKWSETEPTCRVLCPSPPSPSNGQVSTTARTQGSTATYSCNTGYTLVDSSNLTCLSNGQWSGSAPTCQPSVKLMLKGRTLQNNSQVSIRDIGQEENALLCVTDKTGCCWTQQEGALYYPDGAEVHWSPVNLLYRDRNRRDNGHVRLNRRGNALSPLGRYRCDIPDNAGVMRRLYFTITA